MSQNNEFILDAEKYRNTKWNFEIPPAEVPESQIVETFESEILVIGGGVSGFVTATKASELGADVRLFAASSRPISRGGSNCGWGTKVQKRRGITFDGESEKARIKQEIANNGGRVDVAKWWRWIDNSARTMDWLIDMMEEAGYETTLEAPFRDVDGAYTQVPSSHGWIGDGITNGAKAGQRLVMKVLEKKAIENGVKIDYKVVAKYLVKDDSGRVIGAVAQREDDSYVKYIGHKAVVLATGDFSNDIDMVAKYSPEVVQYYGKNPKNYDNELVFGGVMTGDGQKMGLWAGAAWQRTYPNVPQLDLLGPVPHQQSMSNFQGINLNERGDRFMNEDTTCAYGAWMDLYQPNQNIFYVWDADYPYFYDEWEDFGVSYEGDNGPKPWPPEEIVRQIEAEVEKGTFVKADTLREALEQIGGIDVDNALSTIERYNHYCDTGIDEEYHKNKAHLAPIRKAPFYAAKYNVITDGSWLSIYGGLRTSLHNEVCDENDNPIPGLYNVGIMTGDVYGNIYNFSVCGMSIGMTCITLPILMVEEILGVTPNN